MNSDLLEPINKPLDSFSCSTPIYSKTHRTINAEQKRDKKQKMHFNSYFRLLKYSTHLPLLFYSGFLFLFLSQASGVLLPYFSGKIMDVVTIKEDSDTDTLNIYCTLFLITLLLSSISSLFRYVIFTLLSEKVANVLKGEAFERFVSYEIEFFEKKKTGELMSRIGSDIATLRWAIGANISSFLKSVVLGIGSFLMMFIMNWKLGLLVLLLMPFLVVISAIFARFSREQTKLYQNKMSETSIIAEETFSNIRTVKAFSQEKNETEHFKKILDGAYKTASKRAFAGGVYRSSVDMITNFGMIAILWYGGHLVLNNELTVGQLTAFLFYSNSYSSSVGNISDSLTSITVASGVAETLFEMFDYKNKVQSQENGENGESTVFSGNIEFKEATFGYPSKPDVKVLQDFNLKISAGERIAICGSSGGGKSTIVQLLERFYDLTQGELLIDNINIKNYNVNYLRKNIGFVAQEPVLFSGTIEQNIAYGVELYTFQDLCKAAELANAMQFIQDNSLFPQGFGTLVGERGTKLSGGQKQRIAIARALMKKPKILIFDESTSALDAESEFQVQSSIDALMETMDITCIVIAHRLSTIINCKRILVMSGGKVIEEGGHNELIEKKGFYCNLIQKQINQA